MLSAVSQVENFPVWRGDAFTACGIKTPDIASCHRGLEANPTRGGLQAGQINSLWQRPYCEATVVTTATP